MIFLVLPCNCNSGWGVCSTNLAREISQKNKIRYVSCEINNPTVTISPIEHAYFKSCEFTNLEYLKTQTQYPLIQAVQHDLSDYMGDFSGSFKIALTFADRKISIAMAERAKKFDIIAAGSTWCKELLEEYGVKSQVVLQGIDPLIFNKTRSKKQMFLDDFVVFSGGKFELRKGQDITLKAYKILQDRHPDVKLVCAWTNPYTDESGVKALQESGVDMNRVIMIPNMPNFMMPQMYQNTDVGMFPSRCEAGTNLVMMEYMACGKPAIATIGTGQRDLISDKTGIALENSGICDLLENGQVVSKWEEPNVDSAIDKLEWAYNHQAKIKTLGVQGSKLLSEYTWERMAKILLDFIPT